MEKTKIDEFHTHEALHVSCLVMNLVEKELVGHIAVKANPKWTELAEAAHSNLFELYQAIGEQHLKKKPA